MYRPIDGNSNYDYYQPNDKLHFKGDSVIKFVDTTNKYGLYVVQYESCRVLLNLFPNDSVFVSIDEKKSIDSFVVNGSNAAFHKIYNKHAYQLFFGAGYDSIFIKLYNRDKILTNVEKFIAKKTIYIDSLFIANQLTKEKFEIFKQIHKSSILINIRNEIAGLFYAGHKDSTLFTLFYNKYNPNDPIFKKSFLGYIYLSKYCIDVSRNYVSNPNTINDGFWKNDSINTYYYDYGWLSDTMQE